MLNVINCFDGDVLLGR